MKLDILNNTAEIEIIGDFEVKSKQAQITQKNTPYIFALLSKIYSDPIGSIVREITSNIIDAHTTAKKFDEPAIIRKFIDNTNQAFIEFHDKGLGISPDKMDDVYMSYGESDKRESDDFIGAFGLGSKSPFSYSDYFFVITRTDGVEYTYLLTQTLVGPGYDLLNTQEIDLENTGTTIRIPIKNEDIFKWNNSLKSQLQYFSNVYVDGFEFTNEFTIKKFKHFQIREDLFYAHKDFSLHLMIGQVTYPIKFNLLGEKYQSVIGFNAALIFNIGDLKIAPSREEVEYNSEVIKSIENKLDLFLIELRELLLNDKNFIFNNLSEYRSDLYRLNEYSEFTNSNILGKKIYLNYRNFNFKEKIEKNIKYKFNIFGNNFHIKYDKTNIAHHLNCFLYVSNSKIFRKNNTPNISKIDTNKENKFIYSLHRDSLKRYESAYLNDTYISKGSEFVAYLNLSRFATNIIKDIIKAKQFNEIISLNIPISKLKSHVIEVIKNDILSGKEFVNFDLLKIDENYGKIKISIKKDERSILYYKLVDRSFDRKELLIENIDSSFLSNDKIIKIYGEHSDSDNLKLVKNINNKFDIFYCAKKYHKCFSNQESCFHIDTLKSEETFNKIIRNSDFRKKVKTICKANVFTNSSVNYEEDELFFNLNSISEHLQSVIPKKFKHIKLLLTCVKTFKDIDDYKKLATSYEILKLNKFFNEKLINKFVEQIKLKNQSFFKYSSLRKDFISDFFLELNFVDKLSYKKEEYLLYAYSKIMHNLSLKIKKLNKYYNLT